jgi:hypothetical protein
MKEDIIDEAKDIIAKKLHSHIREKHGSYDTFSTLARFLHIGTTSMYRWRDKISLPTKSALEKLQKVIQFTDAEIMLINKAIARKSSLGGLTSWKNRSANRKEKTEKPDAPKPDVEERLRRIEEKVFDKSSASLPRDKAKKYLAKIYTDDWNVSGMRFVLTRENFKTLDTGPWSREEIDDTLKLIVELRRRLVLLAQNPAAEIREDHIARLGMEIDELHRAFVIASSVIPMQAAEIVSLERHDFLNIEEKKTPEEKKGK